MRDVTALREAVGVRSEPPGGSSQLDDEVATKWDNGRDDPAVILVITVRDDGPRRQATATGRFVLAVAK
jgi:hypothetical protein